MPPRLQPVADVKGAGLATPNAVGVHSGTPVMADGLGHYIPGKLKAFVDPAEYSSLGTALDQSAAWQKALDDGYGLWIPLVGRASDGSHRIANIDLSQAASSAGFGADGQISIVCARNANIKPVAAGGPYSAFVFPTGISGGRLYVEGGFWNNFDSFLNEPTQSIAMSKFLGMRMASFKEAIFNNYFIGANFRNIWFRQCTKSSHDATGIPAVTTANILTFEWCRWDNMQGTAGAFAPVNYARGAQYNFHDCWFEANDGPAVALTPGAGDEFNGVNFYNTWFESNNEDSTDNSRADVELDASAAGASMGCVVFRDCHSNQTGVGDEQNSRIQVTGDVSLLVDYGHFTLRGDVETLVKQDGTGGIPEVVINRTQFNNKDATKTYAALASSEVSGAVKPYITPCLFNILGVTARGRTKLSSIAISASTTQTQVAATQLTAEMNEVTVVGTAADAVKTFLCTEGSRCFIRNAHATNALQIFPAVGDKINGGAIDASISLAALSSIDLRGISELAWAG